MPPRACGVEKKGLLCYFSNMGKNQVEKRPRSKKRKIITRISWSVFFILVTGFLIILPSIVESIIISRLKSIGLVNPHLIVRNLGLSKLDIHSLTAGDPENPDFMIPTVSFDFSLFGILQGKFRKIGISGMRISIDANEKGMKIKGLRPLAGKGGGGVTGLPFKELVFHSSFLSLTHQGKKILIPFDFEAARVVDLPEPKDTKGEYYTVSGHFFPYGDDVAFNGALDVKTGNGYLNIETENTKLHRFVDDLPAALPFFFESKGNLKSEIFFRSWKIDNWGVSLGTDKLAVTLPGGKLVCGLDLDFDMGPELQPRNIRLKARFGHVNNNALSVDIPFELNVGGENIDELTFELSDLELKKPAGMIIKNIFGSVSGLPGKASITGAFSCEDAHRLLQDFLPLLNVKGKTYMTGEFNIELSVEKSELELKGDGGGDLFVFTPDVNLWLNNLDFSFSISSSGQEIVSDVNVSAKDVRLEYDQYDMHVKKLLSRQRYRRTSTGCGQVQGNLKLLSAEITGKDGLQAEGVNLDFPYLFPFLNKRNSETEKSQSFETGTLNIKALRLADLDVGRVSGNIKQNPRGFDFSGNIHSPVKELEAKVFANIKLIDSEPLANLDFRVGRTAISSGQNLGVLLPALGGIKLSGFVSGSAQLSLADNLLKSRASIKLEDTDVEDHNGAFKCRSINTEIEMKDMLGFTSGFSQELVFDRLEAGSFILNGGRIVFRIENPETIFVEEGEFKFCDGKVLVNPFRYETGREDFKVTLFCDRIDFDKMVNVLLGKQMASGDAELNGIVPLKIAKGVPVFRDGFLYSTPGVGGNLRFKDSGMISGGVLLVEEAMKDFNYDWIKLTMNTEKERLNMLVLVNGMPAQKLPLTYDTKNRDIVRDKKGKRRLHLKGLLLELHFKDIDLKQLLNDGAKIYSIKKKDKTER